MAREPQKLSVYDVIGLANDAGEWVDGEFEAVVENAKPAQGRKNAEADLVDPDSPNIRIRAVYFGGDFARLEGARCLFHGQGMKAKVYKGKTELQIGEKTHVNVVTAATRRAAPAADQPAPGPKAPAGGAHKPSPEEAATRFHRTMKKTALLWLHAEQYVCDVEAKLPAHRKLTPDLRQQAISSMFITAKDNGLLEIVPALRPVDAGGNPQPFVPPAAPTPDPEAVARAAAEAAEKARLAAEEEAKRRQLDEDVPF